MAKSNNRRFTALPPACYNESVSYTHLDVYKRQPQHNLVRTRCQIALAKDMQKKMNAMNAIVQDC